MKARIQRCLTYLFRNYNRGKELKIKIGKSLNLGAAIALTTSMLVVVATIGVAGYALFFMNKVFSSMIAQQEVVTQLLIFKQGLIRWVFSFLLIGLVASYYLTKIIINPLMDVVRGTKHLAQGDFEYRFSETKYAEINELIKTYNQMAENLQVSYLDLENKVKERTKALESANKEIMDSQAMIVHSEKMRSLGQLVAGITHEINNPINFIYGNMVHLQNYSNALFEIISIYESLELNLAEEKRIELKKLKEGLELDFIKQDLPMLIKSCYEGTERTKNIIVDLKNFSRLEELVINDIDLPKEIETTLNILRNKFQDRIDVIKEYQDAIPLVEGYGGQLNQVFMNVIDNAIYAIKETGKIYIRLRKTKNSVIIEFEDTGCGMTKEQQNKIFDPFFTTKPVGEGTGLGMSIGYKVVQNHNGTFIVNSVKGQGTKYTIELPIKMKKNAEVVND